MRNTLILLLCLPLVLWLGCAQAEELIVAPYEGGFDYSFQSDEEFVTLSFQTDTESAQCTVFSENGEFSGQMEVLHTFAASALTVTVETLKGVELLLAEAETVAVEKQIPEQNLAEESASRKLYDVEITPMVSAIEYHFRAPGHASLLLKYRSSTEKGTVAIYAGDDYEYSGVLSLPYTYDNNNVVLTVSTAKDNNDLYEEMFQTDYSVPAAAEQGLGRLNGITVCIDPGHQAVSKYTTEDRGPGLSGTKETGVGMARGVITRRLESIVVLQIGFQLRDALLQEGAAVVMTRETQDTYLTNKRRAEIAAEAGADFFLRLHCDYRDTETPQGIGIFCPYGSTYAKAIADKNGWQTMGDILLAAMQKHTGQTKGNTTTTNQYVGNNWATMPSFLIEMGYMSNPVEDVLLSAEAYQQRLVEGMVEGIYELAAYRGLLTEP